MCFRTAATIKISTMCTIRASVLPEFGAAIFLEDERAIAEYVSAMQKEDDHTVLAAMLDDIASARLNNNRRGHEPKHGRRYMMAMHWEPLFHMAEHDSRSLGVFPLTQDHCSRSLSCTGKNRIYHAAADSCINVQKFLAPVFSQ